MAGVQSEEPGPMLDRPHLLVASRKIKPADAGEGDGARAHGAGLQRHMQIAAGEPFVPENFRCLPDYQHLGMGGGILQFQCAVSSPGDDVPGGISHDRTNRYLAPSGGGFGLREGGTHWLWQFQSHRAT